MCWYASGCRYRSGTGAGARLGASTAESVGAALDAGPGFGGGASLCTSASAYFGVINGSSAVGVGLGVGAGTGVSTDVN